MESEPGSGFVDNCTCASRFYNNGSRCDYCPRNSYCVNDLLLSLPSPSAGEKATLKTLAGPCF
jgi:hypothetical protein